MLAKIKSFGLLGTEGYPVHLEIDINNGLPGMEIVGLGDAAVKESRERVRSAIKNSGYLLSPKRITINLAPADIKKEGSMYDLGIAIGMLCATEQLLCASTNDYVIIGELALDGSIRHVKGLMPILISAAAQGFKRVIIPSSNANEASYIHDVDCYAFSSLREAVMHLSGEAVATAVEKKNVLSSNIAHYKEDLKYVRGQYIAKRAIEIAAAGGHNILLVGPPGAGKTMLARCIPTILPDITAEEAMETTKIHSVAGLLGENDGIVSRRPFRSPHHTISSIALTGGGTNAKPGEMSLAHNGVLFLDELPEYPRHCLEMLRQPLEDGVITVSRAARSATYPANFMLVASMNPCPCGYRGSKTHECTCTPLQISKYLSKLSGPLMDRIDLHITVDGVTYDDLTASGYAEDSATVRKRVNAARSIQLERFFGSGVFSNSKMTAQMLRDYCKLDKDGEALVKRAFEKLSLSARSYTRILKVARTIADLAGEKDISAAHISEALNYRCMDRENV